MPKTKTPICPKCEAVTAWVRSMPPSKGFVTHCYECPKCTFINTIVELDPTRQAEGWIRSELPPPHQIEPMRLITKKWTEDDVARLSVLLEEGATLLRAASALYRGTSSVQKKRGSLAKVLRAFVWYGRVFDRHGPLSQHRITRADRRPSSTCPA